MHRDACPVRFTVECSETEQGQHLRAVGACLALGAWAPERALVRLRTSPAEFPIWRSEDDALLPLGPCDYKYVICRDDGSVVRWEERANRRLLLSSSAGVLEVREAFGGLAPAAVLRQAVVSPDPVAISKAELAEHKACDNIPCIPSWDSTVSTTVPSQACDNIPCIPSWDSTVSTTVPSQEWSRGRSLLGVDGASSDCEDGPAQPRCNSGQTPARCGLGPLSSAGFEDCFEGRSTLLGEGAFGVVHTCVARATGDEYAVKVVQTSTMHRLDLESLRAEIELHGSLPAHPNVVGLVACFEDPLEARLVLEICRGGDLFCVLDDAQQQCRRPLSTCKPGLSEAAAAAVARQLLLALAFCHGHGVCHRDVKPENLLLSRPLKEAPLESAGAQLRLCDFGYAAACRPGEPGALCEQVGSVDYMAPEVAWRRPYGCTADVWSAGAVLFECLRGERPFTAESEREVLGLVREGVCRFDLSWAARSPEAAPFVRSLLEPAAGARPTAAEALQHAWLAQAAKLPW